MYDAMLSLVVVIYIFMFVDLSSANEDVYTLRMANVVSIFHG